MIFFDGECNLCNGVVKTIIKYDRKKIFKFSSLQSEAALKLIKDKVRVNVDSFILLENGKLYTESTAALRVARRMPAFWKILYGFIIVPAFIRNSVYRVIAKNRYRWFGKKSSCMIPDASVQSRFLK